MQTVTQLQQHLCEFHKRFSELATTYEGILPNSLELEETLNEYSDFIINESNHIEWEEWEKQQASSEYTNLLDELRIKSALCVTLMEKYRGRRLLSGQTDSTEYFRNIESSIREELGGFRVQSDSKVLLVGSGSFPMTPLYIAKQTGAEVIGIDIDDEAIDLGRKVINKLGKGLKIKLENKFIEQLEDIRGVSHIIFSSTVAMKYDLLNQLHPLTNEQVVVAMRYGNQLKSIFNYPKQETDPRKWELTDTIIHPKHVFDVAIYKKALTSTRAGELNG
ncbi:class I SAM-dependent methyltransferase [Paenibacillus zeisoli]|uniref:Class I SAM-dependent methyltransferase n=1 Tax=Paenibacillus zeisoli TaxID=2496267 RepID=A0A3S1DDF5_9BACL|nr:class I SAM-dependent methyltransferase [Paenibacillus zeisoli]RUT35798.1 class I SAM-dependent methyltransferase [Paenibacillus zeisoli]